MLVEDGGQLTGVENLRTRLELEIGEGISPWGATDYLETLEILAERLSMDTPEVARRYGYLELPEKGCENGWCYHPVLGFRKKV